MASINSITGGLSSTSSLRGYGGLSSGLDRDTLIEQLTYGTRTKIEQQKQKSDKLQWQQTALRGIIDKGYNFVNTYASYSSSATNLSSNQLFSRTNITAVGENSKYVSVTGAANSADLFSITGVKQMAADAKITGSTVSTNKLVFGAMANDFSTTTSKNLVVGQEIEFKYGDQVIFAKIEDDPDLDFNKPEDLAKALNKAFEQADVIVDNNGTTAKLNTLLSAGVNADGKLTLTSKDGSGNTFELAGGTGRVLEHLGFIGEGEKLEANIKLEKGVAVEAKNEASAIKETTMTEMLAGKTLTFEYNGVKKEIKLSDDLKNMTELKDELQTKLNSAFGKNRIKVDLSPVDGTDTSKLTFQTTNASKIATDKDGNQIKDANGNFVYEEDKTATLSIADGSAGMLGASGLFGVNMHTSNRVNLDGKIKDSGLAGTEALADGQELDLTINGVKITGITADSTVQEVMDAINKSDADVKISYQKNSDRFVITSNQKGASGEIKMEGAFSDVLFGAGTNGKAVNGQDAIVSVQYAGEDEAVDIYRDSNAFTMDGMTVSLKGTFGYDKDGNKIDDTEAITFDAKVDTENTTKVVKDMINAFNEILEQVNKELKTKPNRDCNSPLTGSQKEDMSESEIKEWNEQAKVGLFYGDSDLRRFANDLRFILPSADRQALSEIGISVSSTYSDNGKLVFDEAKFKAALETDPEKVEELFTRTAGTDADGNQVSGGLMENMKTVMNRYTGTVGATKGVLVQRAGSEHSPLSLLENSIKTQMDGIAKTIDRLLDRLETEENRYISQFTQLESLISQMNNQSSYLSQLSGGY